MIRHIVLFKMKPLESTEARAAKLTEIKNGLDALKNKVDYIRNEQVGINWNPDEKWDLSLVADFDNKEDLDAYAVQPDHMAVKKVIGEVVESRACVDSEI